jgi:hypothetical protein
MGSIHTRVIVRRVGALGIVVEAKDFGIDWEQDHDKVRAHPRVMAEMSAMASKAAAVPNQRVTMEIRESW